MHIQKAPILNSTNIQVKLMKVDIYMLSITTFITQSLNKHADKCIHFEVLTNTRSREISFTYMLTTYVLPLDLDIYCKSQAVDAD